MLLRRGQTQQGPSFALGLSQFLKNKVISERGNSRQNCRGTDRPWLVVTGSYDALTRFEAKTKLECMVLTRGDGWFFRCNLLSLLLRNPYGGLLFFAKVVCFSLGESLPSFPVENWGLTAPFRVLCPAIADLKYAPISLDSIPCGSVGLIVFTYLFCIGFNYLQNRLASGIPNVKLFRWKNRKTSD